MDSQLISFLALAFFFLIRGVSSLDIILQLMGISVLLILIFDYYFNHEETKKYSEIKSEGGVPFFNVISILGHIDLTLGILLIIKGMWGIIPLGILSFFLVLICMKALPFVFGGDIASVLDVLFSIIVISAYFISIPDQVFIGMAIYFIQKGIFSYAA